MGRRTREPADPLAAAEAILADPRVIWFPVRHYSPACALHVGRCIRDVRPAAVLVEGPDDATPLIPSIVDPATQPPITVMSSYVDRTNRFGQNGRMSGSERVPVRYRGWWPLVSYAPEYAALRAGAEVGAELRFIDAPLQATIPVQHVRRQQRQIAVEDRRLAENDWFDALARKRRRTGFDAFWDHAFEVPASSTETWMRSVLVFAWCARHVAAAEDGALAADGTLLREAHMRWHVDRALREVKGPVVVVTGAYHTVALPWTQGKRAQTKRDRFGTTLLCAHSYRALAALYGMNRMPGYGHAVQEAIAAGAERPWDTAAEQLIVTVAREARDRGLAVGTADAVAASRMARSLAALRGDAQITREDLIDAVQATFVKGALEQVGGPIEGCVRAVLVGRLQGRVTPAAGQVPLIADFYENAARFRLDVSGAPKTTRLDLHRQEAHRDKSAWLHRCAFLEVPCIDGWRGPDLATGADLHLISETWEIRWTEEVDDRLLELSDRGATLGQVAGTLLAERIDAEQGDVAEATRLLLQAARMRLRDLFDASIRAVTRAASADGAFEHLVRGLADLLLLHSYREVVPTAGDPRVAELIGALHTRACLALPSVRNIDPDQGSEVLDPLQTLARITLTFDATPLDLDLFVEKVRELVADEDGHPTLRGAGYGVLHGFGAVREVMVARALEAYVHGTPARSRGAGAFLDGLFQTSKGVFLRSPRLLRAVHHVLGQLDWDTFKLLLPDLRRAFTRFVPTEIDAIGEHVGRELGLVDEDRGAPPNEAALALLRAADARIEAALRSW